MALQDLQVALITDVPFWHRGLGQCERIRVLILALARRYSLTVFFLGEVPPSSERLPFDLQGVSDLSSALRQKPFSALIVEYVMLHWVLDYVPKGVIKILDAHDLMYKRSQKFALKRAWSEEEERAAYQKFDVVMMIQSEEHEEIKRWNLANQSIVVPHPVEVVKGFKVKKKLERIAFLASPAQANVEGAIWLNDEVELPISIYGTLCLKEGLKERCPHLNFGGVVESHVEFYHRCDLFINPVQEGSGLKIKMVEALAHGVPILSSEEGCYGIEQKGIKVAKSAREFRGVIDALANHDVRSHLSQEAYEHAASVYSIEACLSPLYQIL